MKHLEASKSVKLQTTATENLLMVPLREGERERSKTSLSLQGILQKLLVANVSIVLMEFSC